jgi:hypothetical protein
LEQLADKYKSPSRYQRDAFIHNLMGIIYQANGDWNNAFIAYRNAFEIYEEDYSQLFGMQAPDQLKKDLLISAWQTGFMDEFAFYKEKFGWSDFVVEPHDAELVFFWHNGLGPIKDEFSFNFVVNRGVDNNLFVFANDGIPVTFPFSVHDDHDRLDLSKLEAFRVAFPRYVERPVYFTSSVIESNEVEYPVELAEDINKIAFKSLQERMTLEFSKSLLRAALKKAAEHAVRKDDNGLGSLVGMVNAMTEKADTRNWQTLPHSISYARVPLKEGNNETTFVLRTQEGEGGRHPFSYHAKKGQTLFHTFSSLESMPARY